MSDFPGVLRDGRERLRARIEPRRRPLLVAAAAVTAVAALLPWSVPGVGYTNPLPGDLGSVGLGGHRLYVFVLALVCLVGLTNVAGRRRMATACALGALVISVIALYSLIKQGGGTGAAGVGAWVGTVGSLVLLAVTDTLPTGPPNRLPRLAAPAAVGAIVVVVGVLLAAVVIGLGIDDETQFLCFAIFVGALIAAAGALGVFAAFREAFDQYRAVGYAVALAAAVAFPFTQGTNATWDAVFARVGVFAAAAIGLNVVVGLAGLLDLGYIAFFGIGGYVSALLSDAVFTTVHVHVPFLVVFPLGAMVAGLIGVAFGAPTLRLRGDYLAIVTLGFGEIFRIVVQNWTGLTQGPNGISGIPDLRLPGFLGGMQFGKPHTVFGVSMPFQANYVFLDIVLVIFVMLVFARLNDSRIGRAWVAIREDELAARAMGINTIALKLLAFGIGATLAGAAGTINAHIGESVTPDDYQFIASALLLSAVVLGGMGTVPGAVLGAALLIGLPEKLRFVQDYRLFLFGLALVLLMRFRPEGLIVSRRRQREFHEGGSGADAMSQPAQVAPV
ncbi:MAG TPA: branched-chain amino acid ABC transporter permease [Mycobacteriales bacterium]|nr:branched-chain amino acid ABC transporter permease [Mycobacteriales bacterium]